MSDEDIQNLSQLQLLESLDLGHRKVKKEESKADDFENVINNLLSKVDNRIDNIKKLSNVEYNIKPFDMDSNSEHNSPNINETKNSNNKNSNNQNILRSNFSNIKSKNYLEDLNNNGNPYINNNFNDNNIPKVSNNLINSQNSRKKNDLLTSNNNFNIFEENKNSYDNDNNNGIDLVKDSNNNDNIQENNRNNDPDNFQNEFELEDIPELDQQTNEDRAINNNNNNNNNIELKISFNNKSHKSNDNMNQDENFKLDENEIELDENSIDREAENNKLLEEERLRKEKEEEEERLRKEEEEERLRKEEEEERLRKEEEEERIRKEKEEEEERLRKEKEEKLNKENKEGEGSNQISIEIVDDINNSNNLSNRKIEDNNKEENNKEENNEYQSKEKNEQKQDDMNFEIDEIESLSNKSINENQNQIKPEKQNKVSEQKKEDENDSQYKIEVIKESRMDQDSKKSEDQKINKDEDKKSDKKEDEISQNEIEEISQKSEDEKKDKKVEKQKDIKLKNLNNKDMRNNSMPQNKENKVQPVKKEIKRSLTQKNTQIKTFITKSIEKSGESQIDVSKIKDFETLENLVQDEVALNELIPDFKEKILDKEDEEDINARQFYITKEKYINNNIKEYEDISLFAADYEESHPEIMKKIYEEKGLSNLPKYENNFEEEIFHESKIDLMNSPIGGVENIESFLQKFFLTNNQKLVEVCNNSFVKWRRILDDGNSFYRVLMFGLFEAYILNSNENELNYIISEIITDEFIEIYKKNNIDYNTCFILLSAILDLVKEKNIAKAYELLVKSYSLKDKSFDKMLIVYIRHITAIYIDKLKEIIDKKHINTNSNIFNSYMCESPNIEPSMLILCIMQYLFNISYTIFSLNGDILKPNNSNINFIDPDEKDIPIINFGYCFSSYYKLYSQEFEEIYNFELNLMENNGKQLTYIFKDERPCSKCVKKTTHILFVEKKFIICKNCLEDHLSYACNFRADAFKQDGFIGLEYYTRPIHLCDNYYINDLEVIELLESFNLLCALSQKYNEKLCDNCKENKDPDNLFDLKCGCCLCGECIEAIFLNATGGNKFLIPYEKKICSSKKCICGNQLDLDTIAKHIKYNQEDEKEASDRLKQYINSLCLICLNNVKEQSNISDKKYSNLTTKFKTIKLKKNVRDERSNGIEYMEIEHLICEKCYYKYIKNKKFEDEEEEEEEEDENEDDKRNPVDLESGKIFCSICCRNHELDPKVMNEGGCCSGGCITF